MPLLNYTTTVAASRTISQIQDMLARAGALRILTVYDEDDGSIIGLSFQMTTLGGPRFYTLPVKVAQVLKVLEQQRIERRYQTVQHAERVAWRIVKDWLEAQLAILAAEMVTLEQVMLPYMQVDNERTLYDLYLDNQARAIEAAR